MRRPSLLVTRAARTVSRRCVTGLIFCKSKPQHNYMSPVYAYDRSTVISQQATVILVWCLVCAPAPTHDLTAMRCQPVFTTRSVCCMSILFNDDCSDLFNGETGDMSPMSGNTHHKRYRQNTMFSTTPVKVY